MSEQSQSNLQKCVCVSTMKQIKKIRRKNQHGKTSLFTFSLRRSFILRCVVKARVLLQSVCCSVVFVHCVSSPAYWVARIAVGWAARVSLNLFFFLNTMAENAMSQANRTAAFSHKQTKKMLFISEFSDEVAQSRKRGNFYDFVYQQKEKKMRNKLFLCDGHLQNVLFLMFLFTPLFTIAGIKLLFYNSFFMQLFYRRQKQISEKIAIYNFLHYYFSFSFKFCFVDLATHTSFLSLLFRFFFFFVI